MGVDLIKFHQIWPVGVLPGGTSSTELNEKSDNLD